MAYLLKRAFAAFSLSLLLWLALELSYRQFPPLKRLDYMAYDALARLDHSSANPSARLSDILIVSIDNQTLNNMPYPWPYPRADFTRLTANLRRAGARAIAFDFVFSGNASSEEDLRLLEELKQSRAVMACAINEDGLLQLPKFAQGSGYSDYGIISKLQDEDGAVRRNITYLVSDNQRDQGWLSWEMRLLKECAGIDIRSISDKGNHLEFKDPAGKIRRVPVDPRTKAYLIRFRAHTPEFKKLSFDTALKGDFDPALVKDKIVLVGLGTAVLGDLHNTPLGWMPGVTLNANAFLTLYNRDFITRLAPAWEITFSLLGLLLASALLAAMSKKRAALCIALEISAFLALSFLLLRLGFAWNYALFPLSALIPLFLPEKLLDLLH